MKLAPLYLCFIQALYALLFASTASAHKVWKLDELEARLADPVTTVEIHALALSDLIAGKSFFTDTIVDSSNQCQGEMTQLGKCLGDAGEQHHDNCLSCMVQAADQNKQGTCNGYCNKYNKCLSKTCTSGLACDSENRAVVNCILAEHGTGCSCAASSGLEGDVVF